HRPIVEEFHKGMKTGCRIESMQFDRVERLEPAIGVLSVVTTTLLRLRDAARAPDADNRLGPAPTIRQFYMHVARLGGHQNRKSDGFPGWLTLWRGWTRLQAMIDGYHALRPKSKVRCGTN